MPPMAKFVISEPAEAILASLTEALDLVSFGIVLLSQDMRVRFVNRRYVEMWQRPFDMLVAGTSFRALLRHAAAELLYEMPASELPAYLEQRGAAIQAGAIPPVEIDLRDGRRLLFRCIPCADGGRILTYVDITRLKEVEELQQQARSAAERLIVEQRFST